MKKSNKGFTLVELIVVLVILAILAAILVPALLGYIDRSRDSQILINAKTGYTASQATASQYYGISVSSKGKNDASDKTTQKGPYWISVTNDMGGFGPNAFPYMKSTYQLMDADTMDPFYMVAVVETGKVLSLSYYDVKTNKVAQWYYKNEEWKVIDKTSDNWVIGANGKSTRENFGSYYSKKK